MMIICIYAYANAEAEAVPDADADAYACACANTTLLLSIFGDQSGNQNKRESIIHNV